MIRFINAGLLIGLLFVLIGCSGSGSPVSPDLSSQSDLSITTDRTTSAYPGIKAMWGFWQIEINSETLDYEIVPLRGVEFTVDVVRFMQPPSGNPANLKLEFTDLSGWPDEGAMAVDLVLTHPFPGFDQFAGFDVMGVFVSSGSLESLHDTNVRYPEEGSDPILLNPDGYTRWMNPSEFVPDGTIMRFEPGHLGNQNLDLLTSTINAYKYYADSIDAEQDVYEYFQNPLNVDRRGVYSAGVTNRRNYEIKFPVSGGTPNLTFQYAVVASWVPPDPALSGNPDVLEVPGDYPESANAQESFFCRIIDHSNLWYDDGTGGGTLSLDLEVFDWNGYFHPGGLVDEIAAIALESQNSLIPGGVVVKSGTDLSSTAAPGSTTCSSVFTVEISGCEPTSTVDQEILITIEQANGSFAPNEMLPPVVEDTPLSSYLRFTPTVNIIGPDPLTVIDPNGGEAVPMTLTYDILWEPGSGSGSTVTIEYSKDDFSADINLIAGDVPNTGSYTWDPVPIDKTETAKIRITSVLGMFDESDDYFSITEPVWFEFEPEVLVENAGVDWHYSWDYNPKDEFSPAICEDTEGEINVTYYNWESLEQYSSDTNVKSSDGDSWVGIANYFGTLMFGDPPYWCTRTDLLKTAETSNGSGYASIFHAPLSNKPWFWASSFDRMYLSEWNQYSFNCGHIEQNGEIGSDTAGHMYFFSDYDASPSGISVKRSPYANEIGLGGNPSGMDGAIVTPITDDGEISHSRSWDKMGDGLALAYFTTSSKIMFAYTTDAPDNINWDASTVVFEDTDYAAVKNPSLYIDGEGIIHICFTVQKLGSNVEYQVLYTRADGIGEPFIDPVVVMSNNAEFYDAHIVFNEFDIYPVVGVVAETEFEIWTALCAREDGTMFLPVQVASPAGQFNEDCDMWFPLADGYNYDALIVYSTGDPEFRRVALLNAIVGTL